MLLIAGVPKGRLHGTSSKWQFQTIETIEKFENSKNPVIIFVVKSSRS